MLKGELTQAYKDAGERDETLAQNLSMGGEENARRAGVIAKAVSNREPAYDEDRRKKEEDRRDMLRRAAEESLRRLSNLNALLEEAMETWREARAQREANDEIMRVLRSGGRLDRNNPDHIELIITAGLDPMLTDQELLDAAEDQEPAVNRAEEEARTEVDSVIAERGAEAQRILDNPEATDDERARAQDALDENEALSAEMAVIYESASVERVQMEAAAADEERVIGDPFAAPGGP